MPEVLAILARYLVIALVQSAIFVAIEAVLNPLIDKIKESIKSTFGLSDNDALTYIANFILDTIELAGLTVVSLKTKLPVKVADKLGFTARNFTRGALPAKVTTGPNSPPAIAKAVAGSAVVTADTVAQGVAATKGISFESVKSVITTIATVVGIPVGTLYMVAQFIDYAAWNGSAFQGTFQKIFAVFGLQPDAPIPKANTVSDDVWTRVYNTYRDLGAYAISDPFKQQSVLFSKQNLIDLVDKVGAQLNLETGGAPAKAVIAATHSLVLLAANGGTGGTLTGATASTGGSTTTTAGSTATTGAKVLTGIVSQGVLSQGLTFTPRPDDLIESVQELQVAAQNNLASWLAALPSRIVYEVKIVTSVITADGFKQTGTTQQIPNGTYSNGTQKYKTVTNKFAILVIYALTDKGARSKLAQITLGPTNSAKLLVSQGDLNSLAIALPDLVTDVKLADVSNVTTPTPADTTTAAPSGGTGTFTVKFANGQTVNVTGQSSQAAAEAAVANYAKSINTTIVPGAGGSSSAAGGSTPAPSAGTSDSGASSFSSKPGASATTLVDWYTAHGLSLPPVSERALAYQGFGLGQSSYYTGTAEQNAKLLAALQSHQ